MRILFCNYEYPPLGGGGGVINAHLAEELARRHEVSVLTSGALGTEDRETRDGVELASFRGDLVNRGNFTAADREPDPELMLRGYERAALTLNFVRSLIDGGFADLHHPENWDLDWVKHSPLADAPKPQNPS